MRSTMVIVSDGLPICDIGVGVSFIAVKPSATRPRASSSSSSSGLGAEIAVGDPDISPDPVADRTAEQFVDRHASHLAGDVPQRLVKRCQRARKHGAVAIEAELPHHMPMRLDGQRVLADQVSPKIVHCSRHRRASGAGTRPRPSR